jgi:hypothetical protein
MSTRKRKQAAGPSGDDNADAAAPAPTNTRATRASKRQTTQAAPSASKPAEAVAAAPASSKQDHAEDDNLLPEALLQQLAERHRCAAHAISPDTAEQLPRGSCAQPQQMYTGAPNMRVMPAACVMPGVFSMQHHDMGSCQTT